MLYTKIKSFEDRSVFSRPAKILAGFILTCLAAACESPPLELNDEAKFALKMEKVQEHLERCRQEIEEKEAKDKRRQEYLLAVTNPYDNVEQKDSQVDYRAKFFQEEVPLAQKLITVPIEELAQRYRQPETTPAEAMTILAELLSRRGYDKNLSLLFTRIEQTRKQGIQTADVNAYVDLLMRFFPKVSTTNQLKIIDFVAKTWRQEPYTANAYISMRTCVVPLAKTADVRSVALNLLLKMEGSGLVSENHDSRYDILDDHTAVARLTGELYAAGGGRE